MVADRGGAPGRSEDLLDRRLIVVTGKGGTGKTAVAAAIALLGTERGKRVLICESEPRGDLASVFESGPTSFEPRAVAPGLFAMSMDTDASLREYLRLQLHVPAIAWRPPISSVLDVLATATPGLREILTIGKLCYEVRERHYDLVVVDAPATGHVIGELAAPSGINDLVRIGAVRHQTDWMLEILGDPHQTAAVIVATPEEMPVAEAIDLRARLAQRTAVHLSAVVVNRVLPELFGRGEETTFDAMRTGPAERALASAAGATEEEIAELFGAAELAVRLRRAGAEQIALLREAMPEVPLLLLPYLFARPSGPRALHVLARALEDELG